MTTSLLEAAVHKFCESTGIKASYSPEDSPTDLHIDLAGKTFHYGLKVLNRFDRPTAVITLNNEHFDKTSSVIVTRYVSEEMAGISKALGLQFIDTAGNAYLNNQQGLFVLVTGHREALGTHWRPTKFGTPASLRVMHTFLADPSFLNAPMRAIAGASKVALGTAVQAVHALEDGKVIARGFKGKRDFVDRRKAIADWAVSFANILRPRLQKRRYKPSDPNLLINRPDLPTGAKWSGEVGAEILTKHYFLPGSFTVYADPGDRDTVKELVTRFRLAADDNGMFEIIEPFWNLQETSLDDVVHPVLIYADLIATGDPRSIEISNVILERAINHATHTC